MNPEVKIIVNEEKRTVVAIATDCTGDAMNELLKCDSNAHVLLAINVGNNSGRPLIADSILLPDTFVGIAHCHPDDEFDVNVGRRIALRKMHKAYNKAKRNILKDFSTKVCRLSENLDRSINKLNYKIEK